MTIVDTLSMTKYEADTGVWLIHKRCFSEAINFYTHAIKTDSPRTYNFYNRGLAFMVKKEYKPALRDFIIAAALRFKGVDAKKFVEISKLNIDNYINELLLKSLKSNNLDLSDIMGNISLSQDYQRYFGRISYCWQRLKEGKKASGV